MTSQPREHALVDRVGAAAATLFFGAQMLIVAEAGHAMPGIPILALLATPFALFAIAGVARVWMEDRGVRIVNAGRTFVLAWEDIERFSLGRHGVLREVGIAEMRDGRRVAIWAIRGPNAATRRDAVGAARLTAAMNAELERRRLAALESELIPTTQPERAYLVSTG
ncbi:MAG: hypothetical protein QOG15_3288 [Solirubrobacteraceae bacterium]|jgi:hypothetical protein|nr:hypothetical protein [Solirubrobacteraceae bacterium]